MHFGHPCTTNGTDAQALLFFEYIEGWLPLFGSCGRP